MKKKILCVSAVILFACGGDSAPIQRDEGVRPEAEEEIVEDETLSPDAEVAEVIKDVAEIKPQDLLPEGPADIAPEAMDIEEVSVEVDVSETPTPDIEPPICPCSETPEFPVCGMDNKTTYKNDMCARCGQCKDCNGCDPMNPLVCGDNVDNWVCYKAECGKCSKVCDPIKECARIYVNPSQCNEICAYEAGPDGKPLSTTKTYQNVCELIEAYGCVDFGTCATGTSWSDKIVQLGECTQSCAQCAGEAIDRVCGDDGNTYDNVCVMKYCPITPGVKLAYLGHCLGNGFCDQCAALPKEAVCADDGTPYGTTYANECAATVCKGLKVKWTGKCCPECKLTGTPACGQDGIAYPNDCFLKQCLGKPECPTTGSYVCGKDGQTYPNECQAKCFGGGVLHTGPCLCTCEQCPKTLDPKCGLLNGKQRSFQNQCFAECLGGIVLSNGLCTESCTNICGTIENPNMDPAYDKPVCGDDCITYPTSCFPTKCFEESYKKGACP